MKGLTAPDMEAHACRIDMLKSMTTRQARGDKHSHTLRYIKSGGCGNGALRWRIKLAKISAGNF